MNGRFLYLVLALSLVAWPSAAEAQTVCGHCLDFDIGGPHEFDQVGAIVNCDPEGCHTIAKAGMCTDEDKHLDCEAQQDFDALVHALTASDVGYFRTTFAMASTATYDAARNTIDVRCGDLLVGRIEMPAHAIAMLTEHGGT